jgi:outer membrane protein assembly factor BamA
MLLLGRWAAAQTSYPVHYQVVDSASQKEGAALQREFPTRTAALDYVYKLPTTLQSQGFISASIDSMRFDSLQAVVQLFLGARYQWAQITTQPADEDILGTLRWKGTAFSNTPLSFTALQGWQERILNYLEETGYPFARIFLDSIQLADDKVTGVLRIDRGPIYKVDSIRVYGDARIDNQFLQRYLEIANGSTYNKKKLLAVSKKLSELTYVQEQRPSDLTLLGTGSVLNLYLKDKKNSQINALVGFLPNSDQSAKKKFLFTGEANILLRNSLGAGETIGLNWQQLQLKSPRLNLLYAHPYVFRSPVGLSFSFDMFRKDSTFLNIAMQLGATYTMGGAQSATIFLQRRQSILNGINAQQIIYSRQLPREADVSSNNLGVTYEVNTTNYRYNPRKGTEFVLTTSAGTKRIRKNNQVLELQDPNNPSFKFERLYDTVKLKTYQARATLQAARYFPLGKQSTFKTGFQGGLYESGNTFRNELFQIGGYRLLRGFDEESLYVSHYSIGTLEYRYLIGQNSNFFVFADGGWARFLQTEKDDHIYLGAGLGAAFETKAGVFNLVWALGKRDDTEFNLRQSKVHLGFINYF